MRSTMSEIENERCVMTSWKCEETVNSHCDFQLLIEAFSEFTKGFEIITAKVKQMYQMITMGGDAELEVELNFVENDDKYLACEHPCSFRRRCRLHGTTAKEELEDDYESVWWRKNAFVFVIGFCAPSLQTDASLRHGRDWCCAGYKERIHCSQLHQGSSQSNHKSKKVCSFFRIERRTPSSL